MALVVKNLLANAGDMRLGFNPWVGRSPAGGRGNPFQYACLKKPIDQGSLVGYNPWDCKELNMTELLSTHTLH